MWFVFVGTNFAVEIFHLKNSPAFVQSFYIWQKYHWLYHLNRFGWNTIYALKIVVKWQWKCTKCLSFAGIANVSESVLKTCTLKQYNRFTVLSIMLNILCSLVCVEHNQRCARASSTWCLLFLSYLYVRSCIVKSTCIKMETRDKIWA